MDVGSVVFLQIGDFQEQIPVGAWVENALAELSEFTKITVSRAAAFTEGPVSGQGAGRNRWLHDSSMRLGATRTARTRRLSSLATG